MRVGGAEGVWPTHSSVSSVVVPGSPPGQPTPSSNSRGPWPRSQGEVHSLGPAEQRAAPDLSTLARLPVPGATLAARCVGWEAASPTAEAAAEGTRGGATWGAYAQGPCPQPSSDPPTFHAESGSTHRNFIECLPCGGTCVMGTPPHRPPGHPHFPLTPICWASVTPCSVGTLVSPAQAAAGGGV